MFGLVDPMFAVPAFHERMTSETDSQRGDDSQCCHGDFGKALLTFWLQVLLPAPGAEKLQHFRTHDILLGKILAVRVVAVGRVASSTRRRPSLHENKKCTMTSAIGVVLVGQCNRPDAELSLPLSNF